eukprot:CAMPEP_0177617950 /NCGR_PEP_ID=MMETSP0419_2-20121207/25244_1 /TAXON_ID=582737 /ORGANISM="Tetraselmis sp., Strain GSL018" /LENGTH=31 /DNA_ID= /DNA_START= /DNA_END= /DNA_ORIENTATION=
MLRSCQDAQSLPTRPMASVCAAPTATPTTCV